MLGHVVVVAVVVASFRAVEFLDDRTAKRVLNPPTTLMLALTGPAVTLLVNG